MDEEKKRALSLWVRKYIVNKYFVVCFSFAVIFGFCGNQSLFHRIEMRREISLKERNLREYRSKTHQAEQQLRSLENPDSLERYAREHYFMREKNEDVYIIR